MMMQQQTAPFFTLPKSHPLSSSPSYCIFFPTSLPTMLTPLDTFQQPVWLTITQISTHILILTAIVVSALQNIKPWLLQHLSNWQVRLQSESDLHTRKGLFSRLLLEHIEDLPSNGKPVNLPAFWAKVSVWLFCSSVSCSEVKQGITCSSVSARPLSFSFLPSTWESRLMMWAFKCTLGCMTSLHGPLWVLSLKLLFQYTPSFSHSGTCALTKCLATVHSPCICLQSWHVLSSIDISRQLATSLPLPILLRSCTGQTTVCLPFLVSSALLLQ